MSDQSKIAWGIHAGKSSEADGLFLKRNCVALGWPEMGDLSELQAESGAFKAKLCAAYPSKKPGAIPTTAGMLLRFAHEMKLGDIVVYPSKTDKRVHIGVIDGPYAFETVGQAHYPHRRPVKWKREELRTRFSQGALYEIGSAMSLFQIRNYADEFLAALEGKAVEAPEDDTAKLVADEIEQSTRDFILKQLSKEMKGHPLADFVGHVLERMGYRCRISTEGSDGGVDIIAHKDELGFEPPIIKVQVKSTEGSVGDPVVSALYGKVGTDEFGLLVTLGTFTNQAKHFAASKSNLRLVGGDDLVALVLLHYEQFDSRYKGLLPLKKVYVPEPLNEGSE